MTYRSVVHPRCGPFAARLTSAPAPSHLNWLQWIAIGTDRPCSQTRFTTYILPVPRASWVCASVNSRLLTDYYPTPIAQTQVLPNVRWTEANIEQIVEAERLAGDAQDHEALLPLALCLQVITLRALVTASILTN